MRPSAVHQESTLRDYLRVVRRRLWVVLLAVILVPAAAIGYSLHQQKEYSASAQVLLAEQDLTLELTGTPDSSISIPADRRAQTQADLAREPAVAQRAVTSTHSKLTAQQLLNTSSVSVASNSDLLTFSVTNHVPQAAQALATAYAAAYVRYRLQIDTAPIEAGLARVQQEIATVSPQGALYDSLVGQATKLKTMAALKTANASVVRTATRVTKTAPKTVRNGILGFVLGALLGLGLAFLYEALDTRMRSSEEVASRLGMPLLARLPEPPRKLRSAYKLSMMADPLGPQAETFRMLRTNIQFASLGSEIRTLMVTSALEQEGKSTTIANLAVAAARAGQRVTLVELDLRRPVLQRFFNIERNHPGITQVALGETPLHQALVPIRMVSRAALAVQAQSNGHAEPDRNGHGVVEPEAFQLNVLTAGAIPPDPGEFIATERLAQILAELRHASDLVLIDAPPILHVGDGLTLSSRVDGVFVVARMDILRRGTLTEVGRLLETMPARKIGVVVTGIRGREALGYGYGYYSSYSAEAKKRAQSAPRLEPHPSEKT